MSTFADCTIGIALESTYGTLVTPTRWFEFQTETFDWNKNVKQGQGMRAGSRVDRSNRRVVTSADGGGDYGQEILSKGMGLLWQACMGSGTSTLVSGTTYQQVFTWADSLPSFTAQKALIRFDGTTTPYTFTGATIDSFEIAADNDAIAQMKATIDMRDLSTVTAYAAASFPPAAANLLHFAGGAIYSGTFTAPTATALASGTTQLANVRSMSLKVNHNQGTSRFNFGGGGRKSKPWMGKRDVTGSMQVEYVDETFRDAVLNETPMPLILTYQGGSLSTGVETLQIVIPEAKFNGKLPMANGGNEILQDLELVGLDNLTAAQPMWIVVRTSDSAL